MWPRARVLPVYLLPGLIFQSFEQQPLLVPGNVPGPGLVQPCMEKHAAAGYRRVESCEDQRGGQRKEVGELADPVRSGTGIRALRLQLELEVPVCSPSGAAVS